MQEEKNLENTCKITTQKSTKTTETKDLSKSGNYTMFTTDRKTQYCEDVNSPQTVTQLIIQEPFGFVLDT